MRLSQQTLSLFKQTNRKTNNNNNKWSILLITKKMKINFPYSVHPQVEPTNLDESLGLDALLSLASGLPEADTGGMNSLESGNTGWMHQQGFSYDMDVHQTFHSTRNKLKFGNF